jgi:hypothetical protein
MTASSLQFSLILFLASSAAAWQNEDNCRSRGIDNVCNTCAYATPSGSDCLAIKTVIAGCYAYNADGTCNYCQEKFVETRVAGSINSVTCAPLNNTVDAFCKKSFIDANTCSVCTHGVLSIDGICQMSVQCADPNCHQCYIDPISTQQLCSKCADTHFLFTQVSPAYCIPKTNIAHDNCWASGYLYRCDTCDFGYAAKNGACYKSSAAALGSAARLSLSAVVLMAVVGVFRL